MRARKSNRRSGRIVGILLGMLLAVPWTVWAATLNVYTAWPESLSLPIFKAYTAQTGVEINFMRLSTGELLARATAERNNPRADVMWGAPGDGFAGAKAAGILEPYKPPTWDKIPAPYKDPEGYYTGLSLNTLIFMTNAKFIKEKNLKPPTSWM
ncbi:MAG: extracellular solute-binding protein, partial [candidate division NC10 bacterium]|nr:extracellular solute-binding protein [candidate division NC10 bacterium]